MISALKSRRRALLVAAGMMLTSAACIYGAAAEPGEFVDGVLQPLADGFPNRPITLINADDPGSRDGIQARAIQQIAGPMSPVEIVVSDEKESTFGTFSVLADTKSREGGLDGYYPLIISVAGSATDPMQEPITEELGMTVDDLQIVIVTETLPYGIMQRKDAPWGKTWAEFVQYAKDHPGEVRYVAGLGSMPDLSMELILKQSGGLKMKKIPAEDSSAAATIVAAGEGDITLTHAAVVLQHWQAGRADVLMVTADGVPPPWDKEPTVIDSATAGLPFKNWGAVQAFVVPKEVPREHVDWLFKLINAAVQTPEYQKREETIPGDTIGVLNPDEAQAYKMQVIELMEPIVRDLGLHLDQKP